MLTDKKAKEIFDYYGVKENVDGISTIRINSLEKELDDELIQNIFNDIVFFDEVNDDAHEVKCVINAKVSSAQKEYESLGFNINYCMAA
ncbi:MAG: hypothetical protein J6O09_01195 [Lachnospiraceae bacterium]|nr:hypothetical protein [Lachnospiraceae bacterium]